MVANRFFAICYRASRQAGLVAAALALLTFTLASTANAQRSYNTPEDAGDALVNAAESVEGKELLRVLGRNGADIVSSGDPIADAATRKQFVTAYNSRHRITMDGEGRAVLVIGADEFPFPIPLVRNDGKWRFDTAAGREEILARRIGRNELSAIQTCLAYVDAQHEYAEKGIDGSGVYAQRIVSRPGKKDGLYWPARAGQEESPLGELAARAAADGYRAHQERSPYHGYYYRILSRQGRNATGGAADYRVRGKMIGGFAMVAFPASYGVSGVMTFLVNHRGVVYQKDLGPRTSVSVKFINAFNPDSTWRPVGSGTEIPR